jgi:hypothetical protein
LLLWRTYNQVVEVTYEDQETIQAIRPGVPAQDHPQMDQAAGHNIGPLHHEGGAAPDRADVVGPRTIILTYKDITYIVCASSNLCYRPP